METKYKELIIDYYREGISLAGITSLLYHEGIKEIRYFELRKIIFKECQRIESKRNDFIKLYE